MIVPMKKVCLMVQDSERNDALLKLREAGVMHLERTNVTVDGKSAVLEKKNKIEAALNLLREFKDPKKDKNLIEKPACCSSNITDLITDIGKERKILQERNLHLAREISHVAEWGDFNPNDVKKMEELGLPVFLYELTPDVFETIPDDVRFTKLYSSKNIVRIIVYDKELQGISPFNLPEKSLSEMNKEIEENNTKIAKLNEKLLSYFDCQAVLKKELQLAEQEIEFENAAAAMEGVENIPEDQGLSWLSGYVPAEDLANLKAAASKNSWALASIDPEETDEAVPTKLKNNKFVGLLNPVTDFLGIVPGYREVDISPWFLIFFCLFFGMIFGDAAYGLIFTFVAVLGMFATAKKGVPLALKLLLLLGLVNTGWGVATCTWFGIESSRVPEVLQNLSIPAVSTAKTSGDIVDKNLQFFCFAIGLVHMTIAHLQGLFKKIKSLKALAEIGSIGMLWGMFNVILFLVVSPDYIIFPMEISIYLLGGGFFLSFVFASYEGHLGKSILESVKNIISVVLGITNVFSDIMSYIRLWAVGLAGASIANTVNTMAGPLLGNFLIFAGIILLVFGHGLNIILNVLSVLVHGVRLNTLEYSSHVGLTWSGTPYRPFAERVKS